MRQRFLSGSVILLAALMLLGVPFAAQASLSGPARMTSSSRLLRGHGRSKIMM